jgi:glyceraldehyde 3-phosphate dehydrogenase
MTMAVKIAINGFGRIGRLFFRLAQHNTKHFEIVAINDLVPPDNLAYLVKYDSVHRQAPFDVQAEENAIVCMNKRIKVFSERDPAKLPYRDLGVDYVVESTGLFTTPEEAAKHLQAGARRVILTAPAKGHQVPTFVCGVNHREYDPAKDTIISNASCTTNCLAPLTKILLDNWGIEEGLMTTIHAMTATQPTVDGPSKKDWRGGRAASINIIPASTGAAKAVALCLPAVKGKLTGMAFRVPTIDVSAVDLTVRLSKETTYEEICKAILYASEHHMKGIVQYCEEEVVSSDFIGSRYSCIFDKGAGIALNSRFYKLIAWYDNEVGYASRVVDLIEYMATVEKSSP